MSRQRQRWQNCSCPRKLQPRSKACEPCNAHFKCSLTAAKNFVDTGEHCAIQADSLAEKRALRLSYLRADSAVGDGRCGRPNATATVDEDHRHDARL
jgi:hypothetical protein